jgi:hypothetical protein
MSCPTIRRFLFLICVAFFSLDSTNARPAILGRYSLYARQADGMGSPTTLVTVQTSQAYVCRRYAQARLINDLFSVMGPMTQTCTIILTPITDGNGNQVVQEVKTCTLTTDVTGDSLGNGQAPFASPSSTAVSSSTTTAASDSCSSASTTASNATQSGPAVVSCHFPLPMSPMALTDSCQIVWF